MGQTSSEWMGLLVGVGIVIAVLVPAGFGAHIGEGIEAAICRIMGGSCAVDAAADSHVPEQCTTLSSARNVDAEVTVFSVRLDGGATLTLTRSVDRDGTEAWAVEDHRDGGLGLTVMTPGGGVDINGTGAKAEAKAGVSLAGGGGFKYVFDSEEEARDFIDAATHQLAKDAVANGSPITMAGPGRDIAMWVMDKIDGHSYDPPAPQETWIEGGLKADASADFKTGALDAGVEGSGAALLGVRQNHDKGRTTYYFRTSREAAGSLGLLGGGVVGASGGADGEMVVAVEFDDATGDPTRASLTVNGTLAGGLTTALEGGGENTLNRIAASVGTDSREGVHGSAELAIDLTQGDNLRVVSDAVRSFGVPVLGEYAGPERLSPVDGVAGLYDLYDEGAPGTTLGVVTYDHSDDSFSASASGGAVVRFGLGGGFGTTDRTVNGGSYYEPGRGMVPWVQCSM